MIFSQAGRNAALLSDHWSLLGEGQGNEGGAEQRLREADLE